MVYLDTSVLGSVYCTDAISATVNRRMVSLSGRFISPLVEVEFRSMLAQKVRAKELTRSAAVVVLGRFTSDVTVLYQYVEVGVREFQLASTWLGGFDTGLRTLDALHLAVASNHGLDLITTDKTLAEAANRLHVGCELIRA